jgi:hypothetical protein
VVPVSFVGLVLTLCAWVRSYWWHTSIERIGGKCTIPTITLPGVRVQAERKIAVELVNGVISFHWAGERRPASPEARWSFRHVRMIEPDPLMNDSFAGGFVTLILKDRTTYQFAGFVWQETTWRAEHAIVCEFPLWFISLLLAAPGTLVLLRRMRGYRRTSKGLCAHCGYDMSGSSTGVCPECGQASAKV